MKKNNIIISFLIISVFFLSGCSQKAAYNNNNELMCIQIIDRNGINETISSKKRLEKYKDTDFLNSQPYKQVIRIYDNKSDKKTSKVTTYHKNGIVHQYLEVVNARAQGKYQCWHENGNLAIEATVIGGPAGVTEYDQSKWIFENECKAWDENGNLLSSFEYEKGSLEGPAYYYYPLGNVKKEIQYNNNKIDGLVITYYENGDIKSKASYSKGKKNGITETFFENGAVSSTENFKNNNILNGKYFDRDGKVLSSIEKGNGTKTKYCDNEIRKTIEYKNGIKEGKISIFKNDIISHKVDIKNNMKNGVEIFYYPYSASPKISMEWIDDVLQGTVITWYDNKQIESQKDMHQNMKNGAFTAWYLNGDIMLVEEYENDILTKGSYYKKGDTTPVSSIINGKGKATIYDKEGYFIKKIKYVNGKPKCDD